MNKSAQMKKTGSAIVVGVGHVGKKHALKLSKLFKKLYIIDPNETALNWCRQNIDSDIMLFRNLNDLDFGTIQNIHKSVAVISNWGVDHYDAFFKIVNHNIDKIYMEKPFSHSLKKIDEISKFVEANNVKLVSGYQLRHSGLAEKIKNACINYLGGNPVLVTVGGGANCIVTNGIHFLDLACSIFDQEPDKVFSKLGNDNINPRGNHLGFWDGFVSFGFNKHRLDISMSNKSSMGLTCSVYSKNGYLTILNKGNKVQIDVFERDKQEIQNDPRIIRTGEGFKLNHSINQTHDFTEFFENMILSLFDDDTKCNIQRETVATRGMLSALISSESDNLLELPLNLKNKYFEKEWQVS
tara:strand:- start:1384 stop:2445 length:1062 start_codon:yes stop_codon:yes gene_type:complete